MINLAQLQRFAYKMWKHRVPLLPKLIQLIMFVCYSSSVSFKTRIGDGSFFNHCGFGVLINPNVEIGDYCKIGNNVSIVGQGPYKRPPLLKNKIFIGPGAVIQGQIIIEDNVIVAPNAVVNMSVPKNAIVAGIPAKIIGWSNELDYDIFKDENWKDEYKPYLEKK